MATINRAHRDGSGWPAVFAVLSTVGALVCGGWLSRGIVAYLNIRSWEEVPATIVAADLKKVPDSEDNQCEATTEYRYNYRGQNYSGNRISLDNVGSFERDSLTELSKHQKSHLAFHCYVNPEQPSESILYRNLPWRMFAYRASLMLVLGGIAFVLWIVPKYSRRKKRDEESRARAHPEEPWLWKKKWATGTFRNSAMSLVAPLLFAFGWNIVGVPIGYAVVMGKASLAKDGAFWWMEITFVILGWVMIGWAVVAWVRWFKYGRSFFEMASVPGVIGGQLAGVIRTSVKIAPEDVFRVKLSCINCVTTHGSESHIHRNLLWQGEQLITHDLLEQDARCNVFSVNSRISRENWAKG
jgi:hypothetical protein